MLSSLALEGPFQVGEVMGIIDMGHRVLARSRVLQRSELEPLKSHLEPCIEKPGKLVQC